jgi:hypothetical protein
MEIKVGDILQLHRKRNVACLVVNDGPSWRGSQRGCVISLDILPDGNYVVDSIVREQGPIPKSIEELIDEALSRL